jgi:hypothetical protein
VRLQAPRVSRTVGRLSHGYSRYGLNELRHRQVKLASTER